MFNTLKYAKMLEEVGFTRDEAEATIKILDEVMEDKLATKQDIEDLKLATKQDFDNLRVATKQDIKDLKVSINELDRKFEFNITQAKSELTIRMGTMFAASIAILTAIQKLL